MDHLENVVIIGSGPAGWSAGIYASRAQLSPLLFEGAITAENQAAGTLPMGQLSTTTEIENYPGFPRGQVGGYLDSALDQTRKIMLLPNEGEYLSGPELVELMRQQAINFGTNIISADIIEVDLKERPFKLTDSNGKQYWSKSIIIATGATANYLDLVSVHHFRNRGVSACAVCDGALPRFRNKPIAVIGGGDSAIEEADYLAKFGSKVYIIHRRDQLRASKVMADRAFNNDKIEILWNRVPEEVLGNEESGVTGLILKGTAGQESLTLDVSGVFMAIGHTPNTKFLNGQVELTEKGFIKRIIPFRTNTNVEGVFAAGDVADDYYKQAITAAGTGCMAALDAERFLAATDV
ncbi:MAG: thioredoxin-disulfide reductase [Planctomycetia bacterium]|nr:thioredoxin-disulfide reductase [Planctomycetia bacterium]